MKQVDFLFIYEVKNRELENISLLAAELENRGYTTAFLNSWRAVNHPYESYDADTVIISACYNTDTYKFFTNFVGRFKKVVNLQWEQVLRNGYVEADGKTSWDFSGEALRTRHICWGENTKNRLMSKFAVPEEFLKVCGCISLDFYRPEFSSFIIPKEKLFAANGLDPNKKTALFISSFAIATMPKENMGECSGDFNSVFVQNTIDSQAELMQWIKKACICFPDIQFIYRAHPSEPENATLTQLTKEYKNFFVLSKEPIKHWIMACDKIYNWTSTSAAEVYASGKQAFLLQPVPIDHRVTYPFFENGNLIKDYSVFEKSLSMDCKTKNQPLDEDAFCSCYMQSETPVYKRICDFLEDTFLSKSYQSVNYPKDNGIFDKIYGMFWHSYLNIALCNIAKKHPQWKHSFWDVRRKVGIFSKEDVKNKFNYHESRMMINYVPEEKIRAVIAQLKNCISTQQNQQ